MDFEFIRDYLPLYKEAFLLTLKVAWIGILISIIVAFVAAIAIHYKIIILSRIARIYVAISRNTPLLIQLFFIYYGLPKIGLVLTPQLAGIVGLAFLGGGYMAETFRTGLEGVNKFQLESAYSLGMTKKTALFNIVLPQAFAISISSFTSNLIFLLKETGVFSAISLMDLMFTAKDLIGLYYRTSESLIMLVVFYLLMLLPVSLLGSYLERRMKYARSGL